MTIPDLIVRLEALEGADREVDGQLAQVAGWHYVGDKDNGPVRDVFGSCDISGMPPKTAIFEQIPHFTASLDAAERFRNAVLPRSRMQLAGPGEGAIKSIWAASVYEPYGKRDGKGRAATAPIAILIAALRALGATEEA